MSTESLDQLVDRRMTEFRLKQKALNERTVPPTLTHKHVLPVITISRQYGAGGHSVAEVLQKRLGPSWSVWDRQLIDAVAHRAEVRREMVQALDEHRQNWLTQMVQNIVGSGMDAQAYKRHLAQVLLMLAQQGKKIIVGRGSNFILPDALNVRLEAALEYRVRVTMEREGLSHDKALEVVLRSDRERADFSRGVFDRDVEDHSAYDMVLQTDSLGIETAAEVILTAARCMFGDAIR
jgi:cytidylate kinase